MNIFHESTIAALNTIDKNGTVDFLKIISKWWSIINNKSPLKGVLKRDIFLSPITDANCAQVIFLKQFMLWVKAWKELPEGLTKDTQNAIEVSTSGLIEIIENEFTTNSVEIFFPGKF